MHKGAYIKKNMVYPLLNPWHITAWLWNHLQNSLGGLSLAMGLSLANGLSLAMGLSLAIEIRLSKSSLGDSLKGKLSSNLPSPDQNVSLTKHLD